MLKTALKEAPIQPLLVREKDLPKLLSLSRAFIRKEMSAGRFPACIRIGRCVTWRRIDLEKWVANGCRLLSIIIMVAATACVCGCSSASMGLGDSRAMKKSTSNIYAEDFSTRPSTWDQICGQFTIKWCDKAWNVNNGNPKGCLKVEPQPAKGTGQRIWYHFDNQVPDSVTIAFDYANYGGDNNHTSTDGILAYLFSTNDDFDSPTSGFHDWQSLAVNWNAGDPQTWSPMTFNLLVPAGTKAIYWQFHKLKPANNDGVPMSVDNIVITPIVPNRTIKSAEKPPAPLPPRVP